MLKYKLDVSNFNMTFTLYQNKNKNLLSLTQTHY